MSDRRVRVVGLPVEAVLGLLCLDTPAVLTRLRFPGLPEGYAVLGVVGNSYARCIDVLVEHPSFDPVPDGAEAPRFPGMGVEYVAVARVDAEADPPVYREVK